MAQVRYIVTDVETSIAFYENAGVLAGRAVRSGDGDIGVR
jgi:hypothetical protein